ncbi:hypothetical protein B0A54_15713 [Friedmanniomyces endolithicus]|uniref:Uncharacterized protein n=1 Tax=Friedmanniomyces endolithicus TaxID=329885 RepID=A0A4U0U8H0_9PEZI|nr:hypothetical protein LTS09_013422 [Friedmanniomyces endolithicus]TKA31580.1 hypothetical protein B0A54_15713 [Friedmanniomyces endolithicus]
MQFFVPDFSPADSLVVGKATLAWTRKNPSVNRMYAGPGGSRDIKAASISWSNVLDSIYPKIPQTLQMMASSSKAKTTFYTASSQCEALETDADASELDGETLVVGESDDEEA